MLSFSPRDVLDEILGLIGSVSEGLSTYSSLNMMLELLFTQIKVVTEGIRRST